MNIEKLPKQIKNKFLNVVYWIRWSVGADFKIIISQKSNATESNHSDESDIEGYRSRFRKNIFRPKYTDVVKTVQSYRIYRSVAISAKHFSFANMAKDSVVNATLSLAKRSKPS